MLNEFSCRKYSVLKKFKLLLWFLVNAWKSKAKVVS